VTNQTYFRSRARVTGVVYLLYFLLAIVAQFLVGRGFAAYGLAVNLLANVSYIALTLLLYVLFKPVNKSLSFLAALLSLMGCVITLLDLFHVAPSHVSPLAFFGPYCLLIGYLIIRSTFLPRILGVLMILAGLGWLFFLSLPLNSPLIRYMEALGIVAEGLLMLWLLVLGVNEQRWKEQAIHSGMQT